MRHLTRLTALSLLLAGSGALAQAKQVIGVSIPSADHGWTAGVVYHANQAKAMLEKMYPNVQIIVKTAKDSNEQANQIQDLLTVNKIGALVILPQESAPLTRPVAALKAKGVFVTVVDRGLTDPKAQDAYVAGDNTAFGRVAGEYFVKQFGTSGANVVVLRGIPTVIDNQRVDAFKAAVAKSPKIKILDAKFGNWNRDDAFKVMQDYLTRFPKIDAVWASDDDMAVGVLKALEQAKRTDVKLVLGGAGMKEAIKKVMDKDKLMPADVTYPPSMIADAIRLTVESRVKGTPMKATTLIPSVLVTPANAKNYYFPDSPF
ncbi:ribose transport system substrate-binding protein [Deinococcus metalli]|jgi:ribose transport system substrate-binding protein|uniref:ABC transporter substrate-binding protein n=1 Tax=Deinococcus metalli TaxID=1141878 RepID=A0A7W8KDQ1_9DEIO|nr:ABC transporter substrate-binding protein [Deinococcus metalli]MBB5375838.1 ribose transport system substrate-binding protein [Deinococcus metalli]GHF36666.1 ABC transporter substrate-binding protein [Deinococcus metalli]